MLKIQKFGTKCADALVTRASIEALSAVKPGCSVLLTGRRKVGRSTILRQAESIATTPTLPLNPTNWINASRPYTRTSTGNLVLPSITNDISATLIAQGFKLNLESPSLIQDIQSILQSSHMLITIDNINAFYAQTEYYHEQTRIPAMRMDVIAMLMEVFRNPGQSAILAATTSLPFCQAKVKTAGMNAHVLRIDEMTCAEDELRTRMGMAPLMIDPYVPSRSDL